MKRIAAVVGALLLATTVVAAPELAETLKSKALPASAETKLPGSTLAWYQAKDLGLEGAAWNDTDTRYARLPGRARDVVTSAVWNLCHNTAGICVRFVTDATTISAAWDGGQGMPHMAPSGSNGVDLYRREGEKWVFCGIGRPSIPVTSQTINILASSLPAKPTEYLLYFPLYARVTDMKIGIKKGTSIAPAPARPKGQKPIVFYGTSITQGGCASRAGMCHTAILGRWLNREVVNLGFSGSGKMEPAMADLLNELDPAVYVLECLPNMSNELVAERIVPFVKQIREKHPDTPILLVENPNKPHDNQQNKLLVVAYNYLRKSGVKQLYYLDSTKQLAGPEEATVDGVHPTDLGFMRMAETYKPVLQHILK